MSRWWVVVVNGVVFVVWPAACFAGCASCAYWVGTVADAAWDVFVGDAALLDRAEMEVTEFDVPFQ